MALGAAIVGSGGEANGAPVFDVARTARGNKRLTLIVRRSLVASETCAVRDRSAKTRAHVAQTASIAKNGVRHCYGPRAVNTLMPEDVGAKNPEQGQERRANRKPDLPAAKGMKAGKILEIDPLGDRLGGAHARHN
jgi:hypothetical protein